MTRFLSRRIATSLGVFVIATYLFYVLAAFSSDPLEDLRASTQKNREQLMALRTAELNLNVSPFLRFFIWAKGPIGCVVGKCDLGRDYKTGQPVIELIPHAMGQTLKLIGVATIVAIVFGVAIGMISALRQYSGFDYGVTLATFLAYSLPSFFIAVLLKQWGAIGFNDFLETARIPLVALIIIGLAVGAVVASAVVGRTRTRLIVGASVAVTTAVVLGVMSATDWFHDPRLGPVVVTVLVAGAGLLAAMMFAGPKDKRALGVAGSVVLLILVAYFPMQSVFSFTPGIVAFAQLIGFVIGGVVIGALWRGKDRAAYMWIGAITAFAGFALLWGDYLFSFWSAYSGTASVNGRPIATVGATSPELTGSGYWVGTLDVYTHLVLPTIALTLVSLAGYTRYARASMLEVMNLDYVRTARAKGLPERQVILRHAFRNALIPLATIVPIDLAGLFGGAVITETVFGWQGMGKLFSTALHEGNLNPLMGWFVVTGVLIIAANILVDVLYGLLDPRIRVDA
jgi:peptide/nickel transport system permease protein